MPGPRAAPLQFGVFDHLDASGRPFGEQYAERLQIAAACDAAGFRGYHLAEHHGTPHGLAPSPNLMLAAVARATQRLRLGPMVMLLNLYHPLRAAEEICMLDQISGGRVDLGIGRGAVPLELSFFGVPLEDAEARYREAAEVVLKALSTDRLTHHGRFFQIDDVPITLAPVQRPHPPLWFGTATADTAALAAARGINIAAIGRTPDIRRITDTYRQRWAETGGGGTMPHTMPLMGMVRHVVIADTDTTARRLAGPAYLRWCDTLLHLWRSRGLEAPMRLPSSFADSAEQGLFLAGSPTTVREALERQVHESGATYVICHLAFGDLPLSASLETIAAIESEIMPAFAGALAA